MLWPGLGRLGWGWDPSLERLRRHLNRLPEGAEARGPAEYPPVNVWTRDADVLVTAELPGMQPEDLDIAVVEDTLTIQGARKLEGPQEGQAYLRRERGSGRFVRALKLAFEADAGKVTARYERGVLAITVPRAQAARPKRVAITSE